MGRAVSGTDRDSRLARPRLSLPVRYRSQSPATTLWVQCHLCGFSRLHFARHRSENVVEPAIAFDSQRHCRGAIEDVILELQLHSHVEADPPRPPDTLLGVVRPIARTNQPSDNSSKPRIGAPHHHQVVAWIENGKLVYVTSRRHNQACPLGEFRQADTFPVPSLRSR